VLLRFASKPAETIEFAFTIYFLPVRTRARRFAPRPSDGCPMIWHFTEEMNTFERK